MVNVSMCCESHRADQQTAALHVHVPYVHTGTNLHTKWHTLSSSELHTYGCRIMVLLALLCNPQH